MPRKNKKIIFFDLDGTLYELSGGSYKRSPLRRHILRNAECYIAKKLSINDLEAKLILAQIIKQYKEEISIGLEKELGLGRYNYFKTVWDIPAHNIIKKVQSPRKSLLALRKNYRLILVSDAPRVWINNVLDELNVGGIFSRNIMSGEGNHRKVFSNTFLYLARKLKVKPDHCVVIGDQEKTDIIPAKKIGMRSIFIHRIKRSRIADANITNISQLARALTKINF